MFQRTIVVKVIARAGSYARAAFAFWSNGQEVNMKNRAGSLGMRSLRELKSALTFSYLIVLLSGCATIQAAQGGRFEFALIGDVPYDARHEKEFANVMKEINAADIAFVVHDGDFAWDGAAWTEKDGGFPPCSDETFQDRLRLAQGSRHPFIFAPGDNDWTDCHRAKPRAYGPFGP